MALKTLPDTVFNEEHLIANSCSLHQAECLLRSTGTGLQLDLCENPGSAAIDQVYDLGLSLTSPFSLFIKWQHFYLPRSGMMQGSKVIKAQGGIQ